MLVLAVLFGVFGAVLLFLLTTSLRSSSADGAAGDTLDAEDLLPDLVSLREFLSDPPPSAATQVPAPRLAIPMQVPALPSALPSAAVIPAQAQSSPRILETRDESRPSLRGRHLETRDEELARIKAEGLDTSPREGSTT